MASFRKRGSGGWQAQVRRKGYPAQSKSFRTRAAAVRWVRSIDFEMDQGLFVSRSEAESTTVAELLDRYLREYTPQKKGAGPESCRIRALIRHPLAERFIATIHSLDIARYRDERLQKVTPGSVRRELAILGIDKLTSSVIGMWECPASFNVKTRAEWALASTYRALKALSGSASPRLQVNLSMPVF
jgi:hypothetical protein